MLCLRKLITNYWSSRLALALVVLVALGLVAGCGATPTPSPVAQAPAAAATNPPPAPTIPPTVAPTTPPVVAPTNTVLPPTNTVPPAAATNAPVAMANLKSCAEGANAIALLETPLPVTPVPTKPPAPTAEVTGTVPALSPTATLRPAPKENRVGYPEDYQNKFKLLFVFDRADNKQVRVICGNDVAASVKPGQELPYGSILVMETWRARQDEKGNVVKDSKGRYIREALTGIFIQRKEKGFGVEYGPDRSGEWEYVAYRPDKTISTPPERTNACASCHLNQATAARDFAFRMNLFHEGDKAAKPPVLGSKEGDMFAYMFLPEKLTVKVGDTIKWTNVDEAEHTITAKDKSFDSGVIKIGSSFSRTFDKAGVYEYLCSTHPAMKGVVEVTN
ncbi:MAG: hypothetical protein EXR62_18205 [Chloroflexi bacterium]|nr:hypothetical protein [Chloroflexota bacterium]